MSWDGPDDAKLVAICDGGWPVTQANVMFKAAMNQAGIPTARVACLATDSIPTEMPHERPAVRTLLLAGAGPLRVYRRDLRIGTCHGRAFRVAGTHEDPVLAFPVFHPETFLRVGRWRDLLIEELQLLVELAKDRGNWITYCPDTCVECRGFGYHVDDQGVVRCEEHAGLE